MTRLKALLRTTIPGLACAALASGALAGGALAAGSHGPTPSPTPKARITHASTHHRVKHAKAPCTRKRKHHGKHSHKCLTRKIHTKRPSHATGQMPSRLGGHTAGQTSLQSGKRSSSALKRTLRAKPAAHHPTRPSPAKEEATTVTVEASPSATIANVLSTPCQNTELMPEAGNIEQVEQATLCLVNQERARDSELPLALNAKLAQAAESHCQEMVSQDYFAHVAPDGETPLQRIEATGYLPNSRVGYTLGENIAWGTLSLATPSSIVAAWIASPEHLANILNSAYRETAVGVAPAAPASLAEGQAGAIYAQELGVIES